MNENKKVSKAQQYLRNSFLIKHQVPPQQTAKASAPGSISPRSNSGKHLVAVGGGLSRNTGHLKTAHSFMPASQSQSMNTTGVNNVSAHLPR